MLSKVENTQLMELSLLFLTHITWSFIEALIKKVTVN